MPPSHPRGRSPNVSRAALARLASQERQSHSECKPVYTGSDDDATPRTRSPVTPPTPSPEIRAPHPINPAAFFYSTSPSPPSSASLSPEYYESPPSPPRSLEDQVHIAYALEDIHLAKILLLRLKGVEVTSDDDPRIAEVQDEDFDFCFIPHGKLIDEREEKVILERQRLEQERVEERRRVESLSACGRIWEEQKRRLREARMMVLKRRELERIEEERRIQRRRTIEEEQRAAIEAERLRYRALHSRRVVNYKSLDARGPTRPLKQVPSSMLHQDPFVYDIMPTTCTYPTHKQPQDFATAVSHSRSTFPAFPFFDDAREVSFADVLKSMQGPLFPIDDEERSATPSTSKRRRETELLRALLEHVERSSEERRMLKGKRKAMPRKSETCAACTADSLTPTSPASSSSWLSFRSSVSPASSSSSFLSASSASTNITTPSTSPLSPTSWFKPNPNPKSPVSLTIPTRHHSCHGHSHLSPVLPSESPLPLSVAKPPPIHPVVHAPRKHRSTTPAKESTGVLVRRMTRFVELARGFQSAYMSTALFSVVASYDNFEDREIRCNFGEPRTLSSDYKSARVGLRPAGYRASVKDVTQFLRPGVTCPATATLPSSSSSPIDADPDSDSDSATHTIPELDLERSASPHQPEEREEEEEEVIYIPLTPSHPRTILPSPLPYKLAFKPIPPPTRSYFRSNVFPLSSYNMYLRCHSANPAPSAHRHHGHGQGDEESQITWRVRSISNPVYLRLKAVQNCVCRDEGGPLVGQKEFGLGSGKEKVVGVAFEGVGRSCLGAKGRK